MQAPRSIINKVDRQQESGKLCDGPDSHAGVIQLEQAVEIEGLPWLAERSGNYRGGGGGIVHTDRSKSMIGTRSNVGFCQVSIHTRSIWLQTDILGRSSAPGNASQPGSTPP